jgi:hypothetical protein
VTRGDTISADERPCAAEITTLCRRYSIGLKRGADLVAHSVALHAARSAILYRLIAKNPTSRRAEIIAAQVRGPFLATIGRSMGGKSRRCGAP